MLISLIITIYLSTGEVQIYSQPIHQYNITSSNEIRDLIHNYNACIKYAKDKEKIINTDLDIYSNNSIDKITINCVRHTNKTDIIESQKIKKSAELLKTYASIYKLFQVLNKPIIAGE